MALGKSLAEVDAMPLPEFRQWQAYASVNLIGLQRDDWRIAQLGALYANAHRGKGQPAVKTSEFMWQPAQEEPDPDDAAQQVRANLSTLPAPPVLN
jgi:hypothetical protein